MPKKTCRDCFNQQNCRRKHIIHIDADLMEQFHFCFYGRNADEKDKVNAGIKRTLNRRVDEALAELCPFFIKKPEVKEHE